MMRFLLFTLFVLPVLSCDFSHIHPMHTMCIYREKQCSNKELIISGGVRCQDKEEILHAHNELRQKIALGNERGQPAATNMKEMVWDEELAMIAQRWADQCNPGHDKKRNVGRFMVGQNVAATWTYNREPPIGRVPEWNRQVNAWYNEVADPGFPNTQIEPFVLKRGVGHYTQLVWAESYKIGCGFTYYKDPTLGFTKLYVCNYGPAGNVIGAPMYKRSNRGFNKCTDENMGHSAKYNGLCQVQGESYQSQCTIEHGFTQDFNNIQANNQFNVIQQPAQPKQDQFQQQQQPQFQQQQPPFQQQQQQFQPRPRPQQRPEPVMMQIMQNIQEPFMQGLRAIEKPFMRGMHMIERPVMNTMARIQQGMRQNVQEPLMGIVRRFNPFSLFNNFRG